MYMKYRFGGGFTMRALDSLYLFKLIINFDFKNV